MTNAQTLLDGESAAQFLGLSKRTLDAWRTKGLGPRYLKLGRTIRYRKEDLDRWLETRERQHTHDTPDGQVG